jgi:hypothetical protein
MQVLFLEEIPHHGLPFLFRERAEATAGGHLVNNSHYNGLLALLSSAQHGQRSIQQPEALFAA